MKSLVDALQKESFGDLKTKKKEENYKQGIGKHKGKSTKRGNKGKDKSLSPVTNSKMMKVIGAS